MITTSVKKPRLARRDFLKTSAALAAWQAIPRALQAQEIGVAVAAVNVTGQICSASMRASFV